jgi:hypothetical protein
MKNTYKTPQKTSFEGTKKSILEGNTPLYTVRECQCSSASFGGVFQCSVPHSEGALAFFERIFGLSREIREESLHI